MPKAGKIKYYAVKVGREGPKIYNTWDECKSNVSRWPSAVHKSFPSQKQAEEWLAVPTLSVTHQLYAEPPKPTSEKPKKLPNPPPLLEGLQEPKTDIGLAVVPSCSVSLSPEQLAVLKKVKEGRNVFFTGSAGTGKSVLLREIIRTLGGSASETLGITASTGIASVNIGGTTLHSWAGIGLGQEPAKNLAGKFLGQTKFAGVLERWRAVETLVIDEISMVDGDLFDKLEYIARAVRQTDDPFGGIQLVLSGDFCQLPPVPDRKGSVQSKVVFAFDAASWDRCVGPPVTLTRVFRQKDQAFVDMLNAMRFGDLNPKSIEAFKKLSRPVTYNDCIEPTELFATRGEVSNANNTRLRVLPDPSYTYQAKDTPGQDSKGEQISEIQMQRLLERLVVSQSITLKVGAQVMLIKNLIQGQLVNGSVGQVIGFSTPKEAAQNHTEIAKPDEKGAAPNPAILSDRVWPLVRFTNGRVMLCIPTEFTVNNAGGEMEARRIQIPLILAWALSVHKSQGQTLERVKVDLRRTFEKGQAYVALSRATSMQHLQVLHFDPAKVAAHPRVLAWYRGANEDSEMYLEDDDEMDNDEAVMAYHAL